ncbi:MAG: L-lactate dehydrogenase [Acidobacteriales bacterium]|nr:L-lactate dehydrogenase [Terriglobales bacterium]
MPDSTTPAAEAQRPHHRHEPAQRRNKIGIVGAGRVGTTVAYAALIRGVAKQISLYDPTRSKVDAEVLDLNHGLMFVPMAGVEGSDDMQVLAESDVIVFAAGASHPLGQTRMDLAAANAAICRDLLPKVQSVAPHALTLMVTNPVDVLTEVAIKITGHERACVFGSGTVLDSSRFRFLLARHFGVSVQSVHAYIAGEHGDSEIPLWSSANIGNVLLNQWHVNGYGHPLTEEKKQEIFNTVKNAGYQVLAGKGATNYAIGLAVVSILEAIFHDEGRVLPVSSRIEDYQGISGVCLSVPAIVDRCGVESVIPLPMTEMEQAGLKASAERIRSVLNSLGY